MPTGNRFKDMLAAGERPVMAWMWNPSVLFAEIMCDAGYDSIGIDLQHGAVDFDDLYGLLAVISGAGVTPMVRIPATEDLGWVTRLLDAGARGLICPNVDTPEQAQAFADACRYPPAGTRGFGPVRPGIGKAVGYAPGADAYSTEAENESIAVIVQIESAEGLTNAEAIVSADGVDSLYPGPYDLSLSMYGELVTDIFDDRIRGPLQRMIDIAHGAGKTVGLPPFVPERVPALIEMGTDWFQIGNDVAWITAAARQTVEGVREAERAAPDHE